MAAVLALLLSAQGAAAQPAAVLQAGPPSPGAPMGGSVFVPANCLVTIPVASSSGSQTIPDQHVITSTIDITASVPYVWNVTVATAITHTASGDLDIKLISPAGTEVTLAHHLGGLHHDVFSETTWIDYASVEAAEADYNFSQPNLMPEEAMGAFQGENGTGPWRLVISDDFAGDAGRLLGWVIGIYALNEAPITTTSHFSENVNGAIPEAGSIDGQLLVGSIDKSLVRARLTTNITHPDASQLAIVLTSPLSLTTDISIHNGFGHADWFAGTQWYDKAGEAFPPGPVVMETTIYPASPLTAAVPEGALGHFLGLDPNGVWKLHVANGSPEATGTLKSWALDITTGHCLAHEYLPIAKR